MGAKDGGPAFPCEQHETQDGAWNQTFGAGMSLRDYFAAKAMPVAWEIFHHGYAIESADNEGIAKCAYQLADAMLRARATESNDKGIAP